MPPQPTIQLELFYSYSHKDEELRDQLENHLAMLRREGVISGWHDRRISAGQEWGGKIDEHLNSAEIILLLVSSDFLASTYCYDIEVKQAMERHEAGEVRVVPIIVRPCDWHGTPFGKVQALPKDATPVTKWTDRDEAFLNIANGIRHLAQEITARSDSAEEHPDKTPLKPEPHLLIPDLRVDFVQRTDKSGTNIVKLLHEELSPLRPRLVVLWGAGGVGKTAIAAEVVRELIATFGQRVVWVSADGLEGFSLSTLLDGIASQLGHAHLRTLPLDSKKEQVRALVKAAPTLVALDNFETIDPAERASCVDWLGNPTPCSALITTRDMIEAGRNIPIEEMRPEEARELLEHLIGQTHDARAFLKLDRDRLILTAESNPLVLQWIVGQIDLAQDPDEVLDDLRHGEGSAAERVFNRSFELKQLDNGGRAVLLALSLFAPSATRKAVAEVSGLGKDRDRKKFKDAVKSLSALWLIQTTEESKRLAVEGLTRELTKARLDTDPRGNTFRPRFVTRFLRFADSNAQPTREDYNALELEKDNLSSAMDIAVILGLSRAVLRLADCFARPVDGMLSVRGYWDQALRIGEIALGVARSLPIEDEIRSWANSVAIIYERRGDNDKAALLYNESLQIAKKLGNQSGIAHVLHNLAGLVQNQGNLDEARRFYAESLEIEKKLGNQWGIALTLHNLAGLAQEQGALDEARQLCDESLVISRRVDNQLGIAYTLSLLAVLAQGQGNFDQARLLLGESLEIAKKFGDQHAISIFSRGLGQVAQDQGELAEARSLYNKSLEIAKKLGDQSGIANSLHQLARLHLAQEDYEEAETLLQEALNILKRLDEKEGYAACLESFGQLRGEQGQLRVAQAFFDEALGIAERLGTRFRIASVKHSLGLLAEKEKDGSEAAQLLREALGIFEKLGSPKSTETSEDLARVEGRSSRNRS